MVEFQIRKFDDELKLKFEMSESERLEHERLKRIEARKKRRKELREERKLEKQREEEYKLENAKWERKRAKELRDEKKKEEELFLKEKQEREKRIEVLRIEEHRIINTSGFMLSADEPYIDPSNDTLLELKKRDMLESVRANIKWELNSLENLNIKRQTSNSESKSIIPQIHRTERRLLNPDSFNNEDGEEPDEEGTLIKVNGGWVPEFNKNGLSIEYGNV